MFGCSWMRWVGPHWIRGRHRPISSTADPAPNPSDFTCQPAPAAASLIPSGAGFKRMFQWPPPPRAKKLLDTAGRIFAARSRGHTITKQTADCQRIPPRRSLTSHQPAAFPFLASREPASPPGPLRRALCPCGKKTSRVPGTQPPKSAQRRVAEYRRCRSDSSVPG